MKKQNVKKQLTDLQIRLSENVKRLRTKAELSQQALAQTSGVHRTHVSLIERCACNPSLGLLSRLAVTFKVRVVDLLR